VDKIKSLWEEQRALFLVVAVLLIVVLVFAIINPTWILYLVVGGIVLVVLWLTMDTVLKARKRKRQENLDERIAAKEGIDDRKREWLTWSQELRKHGIDRYELPFYLLVGEPQSGKSILLQNSGLNFPLGQTKLSGPGGTRGCDWWFTEEAVVLDLAGRLFTHEGGASDATEWEAFLGLLAGYRPLSPANGILLVIPCDSLLQDSAEETKRKATRIQESLTTLVDKLEAQLPIYVVLTKADKIFGFAESVHRLDSERRRQMFGWSRSADDFEKPFSMPEFRKAFDRIRTRAHLIRAGALSSAQVPDALPEIDRLFAFPEELGALAAPLESYMERIFSESALVERLFFRGLYLGRAVH
jgi:type VI secretion system protein ImpL